VTSNDLTTVTTTVGPLVIAAGAWWQMVSGPQTILAWHKRVKQLDPTAHERRPPLIGFKNTDQLDWVPDSMHRDAHEMSLAVIGWFAVAVGAYAVAWAPLVSALLTAIDNLEAARVLTCLLFLALFTAILLTGDRSAKPLKQHAVSECDEAFIQHRGRAAYCVALRRIESDRARL